MMLTCHCSVGVGLPVAAEVNVVLPPELMVTFDGFVVRRGAAFTVSVAAVVVAVVGDSASKSVLLKTASY